MKRRWFAAIRRGDVTEVGNLRERCAGSYEPERESDSAAHVFPGFCGAHLAAYLGFSEVLRFLLPSEAGLRTTQRVFLAAPAVSTSARVNLGPGSTALMLTILSGNVETVRAALDMINRSSEIARALLGALNADGESALRFAIYAAPGEI